MKSKRSSSVLGERWLKASDSLMSPIEDLANMIAAIAIFLLMVLGTSQIILRSAFNKPVTGYIDMVELSMAGMAFLGAAYCQRLGGHVRMEILLSGLKGRWRWALEIFGTLAALLIIGLLTWSCWEHFLRAYEIGDSTMDAEFPVWPSKLLVPIAFSLWFIRLGIQLCGSIRLFINPSAEAIGIAMLQDAEETAQGEIQEAFGEINVPMPKDNRSPKS